MIDVCNARLERNKKAISLSDSHAPTVGIYGTRIGEQCQKKLRTKGQSHHPIDHLKEFGISDLFRLAISHPDMDHMDGIADLFEYCRPTNYYDTDNDKEMSDEWEDSPYREEDWLLYKELRDSPPDTDPKAIRVFSGDTGIHRRKDWNGKSPGDAFYTLAPTPQLVNEANEDGEYNDASYVFMYWSPTGRIVLSGDSHDKSWEHILATHSRLVANVDLLIAPTMEGSQDARMSFLMS